jgi:DNA-binding NarL/FixJ family response regulator
MTIRIILVDDHAIVREGVAFLLDAQPDIEVVGSFGEAAAALRSATAREPDVAVLDIAMPQMNGVECARLIHDACPATQIVMLSMHASLEHVYQAMRAGARGYVLKEAAGRELVEAVRAVHAGQRYFSRRLDADKIESYLRERGGHDPLERLSKRERQVVQLIAEGMTSAEVATRLNLSPKSVDTYRGRVMRKLELDDLAALVKFAIRHGITSVE